MSDSLVTPPGRLLCPWDFPGKNTGVGCHFLFQEDLPDPGIKPPSPALAGRFSSTEPWASPQSSYTLRQGTEQLALPVTLLSSWAKFPLCFPLMLNKDDAICSISLKKFCWKAFFTCELRINLSVLVHYQTVYAS